MKEGKDDLKQWAKDHYKVLFIEPDSKVNETYRQVVEFANKRYLDQHWIREFLKDADPWVIAQANAHNLTRTSRNQKGGKCWTCVK